MKIGHQSLLLRALKEQHGQVLPWVAFMMSLMLGMGAFVLDVGHAVYCQRELQAATDASALAGAQSLTSSSPTTIAASYSAASAGSNTYGSLTVNGLNTVSIAPGWPKFNCLTGITQAQCVTTTDASGTSVSANAIQVQEVAYIPTFFARTFGISELRLSAISSAAIVGARNQPTNIAIVLDTTASMQTVDTNCLPGGGSAERIVCAEEGAEVLLQKLSPCNTVLGCGGTPVNGVAPNPLDQVAIFTFPNVTVGTAQDDYNCGTTNPTIPVYSLPTYNASGGGQTTYAPSGSSTATYQITSFESDYKSQDSGTTLVTSSDVVMATGAGISSGKSCPGMAAPGGDGTYYAGVIYAAQAALTQQAAAEVAANSSLSPTNIMIILTDGEANASSSKIATTMANGTKTATTNTWPSGGGATSSITNYPSPFDQCQQAVAAANYARSQGTLIYTIAYGSESSGCTTDTSGPQPNISPCNVMAQMASPNTSKAVYFYSDYTQSGSNSTCVSPGSPITNIGSIFGAISNDLLLVRLIPEGAFSSGS